jgi:type I restriction enzyme, S subunit
MESVNKDIPKGYKESPLGIIPEDWSVVRLKDKFDRITTKNEKGVTNVLTISAQHGLINQEEYFNKSVASKNLSTYTLLSKGDFAYNKSYSNGYPYGAIKKLNKYDEGVVSSLYICFRPSNNNKSPDFYEQYFEAGMLNREIHAIAQEGARNHGLLNISIVDFFNSYIIDGDERELNKIADILNTWDKAIELKEKLIDQKKEQKKGLMQKLLTGEVRLRGFEGEWKVVRIRDLSSVVTGTTPSTKNKDYYENGTYPWITPTDITDSKYISNSERKLTEKGIEKGRFVPAGSLLITCIASIGKNAILTIDGSCNQQINAILPSKQHSNEFLYYKLKQDIKRMEILAGKSATAIINKNTFENFKVSIPELEEQKAIAKVLSVIDDSIELSLKEVEQLKIQKKGLMQLLLTGKVRIRV